MPEKVETKEEAQTPQQTNEDNDTIQTTPDTEAKKGPIVTPAAQEEIATPETSINNVENKVEQQHIVPNISENSVKIEKPAPLLQNVIEMNINNKDDTVKQADNVTSMNNENPSPAMNNAPKQETIADLPVPDINESIKPEVNIQPPQVTTVNNAINNTNNIHNLFQEKDDPRNQEISESDNEKERSSENENEVIYKPIEQPVPEPQVVVNNTENTTPASNLMINKLFTEKKEEDNNVEEEKKEPQQEEKKPDVSPEENKSASQAKLVVDFIAFPDADKVFDTKRLAIRGLMDVRNSGGIRVSRPVKINKVLRTKGNSFYASLSHKGILAICSDVFLSSGLQITDLTIAGRQVDFSVESSTHIAFYDDKMIALTSGETLREAKVEDVFGCPKTSTFKKITDIAVYSDGETSSVHYSRQLYYKSLDRDLYVFNVDTRSNTALHRKVYSFADATGIDCGIKFLFQDYNDEKIYSYNEDNTVSLVSEYREKYLSHIFPSTSNPTDIKSAAFKIDNTLVFRDKKNVFTVPFKFEPNYSLVRIVKDIFLVYDQVSSTWVLARIVVP